MKKSLYVLRSVVAITSLVTLVSCSTYHAKEAESREYQENYAARLPPHVDTEGKKLILINPTVHAWGAYDGNGDLIRAGIATAGGMECPPDDDEPSCQTSVGTFH